MGLSIKFLLLKFIQSMRRKLIVIFLVLVGMFLIAVSFLAFFGVFKTQPAGIQIETEPKSDVFINGVNVGKTPYEATRESGDIVIRLVPESDLELDDYETKVYLVSGVKTIIKRSFKESEEETSGATVSFEKTSEEESLVTVVSIPDNAQISIGGRVYGFAPLRTKIKEGEHELLVSKEGYLDKKLSIRSYNGYKLTAVVKLQKNTVVLAAETPVISQPESTTEKIEILNTDIGFLRVRSEPKSNSELVGQVKPGEVFDVWEKDISSGWYKIKFEDKEGWVSGEFVKLQSR